jgi:predicted phosphoribosyltransferase
VPTQVFADRREAGRLLGEMLRGRLGVDPSTTIVLGLPRGGVPVAAAVATALSAPLDVLVVRKVGVPSQPELAMGAVGPGGVVVRNDAVLGWLGAAAGAEFERVAAREREEVLRRELEYRAGRAPLRLDGRCVIVVDDGVATGASLRAAIATARALGARKVVVATPVAAGEAHALLEAEADAAYCLQVPPDFRAVGAWYRSFPQLDDDEVRALLRTE